MNDILRIAKRPATSTRPGSTVQEVCETMVAASVAAVVVVDEGRLVGIVSARDVVGRVVARRLDPAKTLVSDIMTREVCTASPGASDEAAMEIMDRGGFRHLPLVDAGRRVVGVVSVLDLLRHRVEALDLSSQSLIDYFAADGPGG
jgi:CBS domain-containing protein